MERRVPGEYFRGLAWIVLALLSAAVTGLTVGFVSGTCSSPGPCEFVNVASDPGQFVIAMCLVGLTTYLIYRAALEIHNLLKKRNRKAK